MKVNINNSEDLKNELLRLTLLKKDQEAYLSGQYQILKNKVETPTRILNAVTSNIPGVSMLKGLFSSAKSSSAANTNGASSKSDWLTQASRIVLPLILNKTLLKNSGWLKKTLVLLASEGAAGQISKDKVSSFVGKISDYIRPSKKKTKKKHQDISSFEEEEPETFI